MPIGRLIAAVTPLLARNLRLTLYRLGGLGFIPLGLLDNSVIPVPGSMDVMAIVLSARQPELWLYYALMATAGSVIGGFVTYRVAGRSAKGALTRWLPKKTLAKADEKVQRWGFGAIAVPALLPPPVPMVPFLFAAGTMQYSIKKLLAALTLGRIVRYCLLAFLAATYGRRALAAIARHNRPVMIGVFALIIGTTTIAFFVYAARRPGSARS
jgi:membrane protein YqaA with SNARE-associated domain